MIDKETLIRVSKFTGMKPFQQEKNYIQLLILKSIYSTCSRELVFKGGTALTFFYNLNRFSEDLDFTLTESFNLKNLVSEVGKDLEAFGVRNNIIILEDNSNSFSFRIGAEGPLFTKEIERCFVRVEISKREKLIKEVDIKELKPIYVDISPFLVTVMNVEEILSEKIRALLHRVKSKDLYDVWFLLKNGTKFDIDLINKKLSYYEKVFDKNEFITKISSLEKSWSNELKPIIMGNLPEFSAVKNFVTKSICIKAKVK
jgi:predicted nucleotidyltransferase component of viral defense system